MLLTKTKATLKKKKKENIVAFYIPIGMVADLDDYARSVGRSRSAIVRWAVREYLTRNKRPELAQADSDD